MNIKRELEDGNMGVVAPGSVEQFFPVYVPPPVRNPSCFLFEKKNIIITSKIKKKAFFFR